MVERSTVLHWRLPQGKGILFKKALAYQFFQIFSKASVVDGLVSLTVMVRTIFFHPVKCRVVLNRLRAFYPWLILNGIEDFIDEESQPSEVLFHLEGLE